MGMTDRVLKRLEKEAAEEQRRWEANAPEREKRYEKIDKHLDEYDRLRDAHPYTMHEDARRLINHIGDEYLFDLVEIYRQFRRANKK